MVAALIAGIGYFVALFAFGMGFGALRELIMEPALGDVTAVLLELPLFLGAC